MVKLNVSNVVRMFGFDSVDELEEVRTGGVVKSSENEDMLLEVNNSLMTIIARLKTKVYKEQIKNEKHVALIAEVIEHQELFGGGSSKEYRALVHKLRNWVAENN